MQFEYILTFIGGVMATLLPLLFAKKKVTAETGTVEVQSAREVIAEWKSLSDEFKSTITRLEETNKQLLADNANQREKYNEVLTELHQLRISYAKLEKSYQALKRELQAKNL